MWKGFKQFVLRGNALELAVAVVIGAAFGAVVTALVKDILTPLLAAIGGKPDFSSLTFTVNHSQFKYGDFLNAIFSFLIASAAVYFLVLLPINRLIALANSSEIPTKRKCPECLSEIPLEAKKCAFCASIIKTESELKAAS